MASATSRLDPWILANLIYYRLQTHRRLSLSDFMDFLRRSCWKLRPLARTIANGEVSVSTRVKCPMDSSLRDIAMPGRISPQPAAPHHGPQRMYTPVVLTRSRRTNTPVVLINPQSITVNVKTERIKVSFEKKTSSVHLGFVL